MKADILKRGYLVAKGWLAHHDSMVTGRVTICLFFLRIVLAYTYFSSLIFTSSLFYPYKFPWLDYKILRCS